MGYDLHITRQEDGSDEEGPIISAEEWLRVVEEDPELRLSDDRERHTAYWNGPSEYPDPWLHWFEGDISTKYPDDSLIDKMVEISKKLDARVQGDDGEIYSGGDRNNTLPPLGEEPKKLGLPWWRRLLGLLRP